MSKVHNMHPTAIAPTPLHAKLIQPKALILFAHGSRDARWREPLDQLRSLLSAQQPDLRVELAFLELMQPDLPTAALALAQAGASHITVCPVFLGQGGHVRRDLPLLITQTQTELAALYPNLTLSAAQSAGEDAAVLSALADWALRSAKA